MRAFFNAGFSQAPIARHTFVENCDSVNLCQQACKLNGGADRTSCYGNGRCWPANGWLQSLVTMETLHSTMFTSPVGPLFLAASERGLVALEFDARLPGQQTIRPNPRDLRAESKAVRFEESASAMRPYVRELEEYFAGKRREFAVRPGSPGHGFSTRLLARFAGDSLWRDPLLRRHRARGRQAPGISRRGYGEQSQSGRDRRAMPSRDRLRWHALRIRRRPRRESEKAAGTGRRMQSGTLAA